MKPEVSALRTRSVGRSFLTDLAALFAGLCLLLSYHVLLGGTFRAMITDELRWMNQFVFGGLLLGVSLAASFGKVTLPWPPRVFWLLCAAVAWEGIAASNSPYPLLSVEVWGSRFWYVSLAYAAFAFGSTPERRRALIGALLVAGYWPLLIACGEFADWVMQPGAAGTIHDQRSIAATFNHSNDFACYLALLMPLALGIGATRVLPLPVRLSALIVAGGQSFFLGLTLSRSGWLGAAMALATMAALSLFGVQRAQRFPAFARVVIVGLLIVACFRMPSIAIKLLRPSTPADWQTTRLAAGRDYGFSQRLVFWRGMARMVRERPVLGWGPGMIPLNYPRFADRESPNELPFHAHNLLVQAAVEGGLIGASLWTLATALIVLTGRKAWSKLEAEEQPLHAAMFAALLSYLTCGIGQDNHANPAIHVIPMILAGVLVRTLAPTVSMNRKLCLRALGTLAFGSLLLLVLRSLPRPRFEGDPVVHYQRGRQAFRSGKLADAVHHFERATELDPNRPTYWCALAAAQETRGHAKLALRRAVKIIPPEPRAYWMIAEHLSCAGNHAEAAGFGQHVLNLLEQGVKWKQGLHIPTRYYRLPTEDESVDELPAEPSRAELRSKLNEWRRTQ